MNKKTKIVVSILIATIFGGLILYNIIKGVIVGYYLANYQPPPLSVSIVKAVKRTWTPTIPAVGNFVATNGVEITSQASGNVVATHFESGQYTNKNDPLIDIDDSVEQANLKFNQSDLVLQELNFKRQENLLKTGATSGSIVDESRAKLLQAQARVEEMQARIQQKHIRAPFAGKLGINNVDIGQYIDAGKTEIVSLQSMDPLYIEFYLPEQLIAKLHPNQRITFAVEKNPGISFEGKITAINVKAEANTHNVLIQATVPNCPAQALLKPLGSKLVTTKTNKQDNLLIVTCNTAENLKNKIFDFAFIPGMFAAIQIEEPTQSNMIVLPTTAISYSLYGESVFVINKDADGLWVKRKFIRTGDSQGNYTIITEGIREGETIVSTGELKLEDGTRVVITSNPIKDAL